MSDLAFYQHLFTETIFVLPENQAPTAPPAPEEKPAPYSAPAPPAFPVQGANRKGLVLLVHLPEAAFKALPDLDFFQKMLKAIGHELDDVAFVNAPDKGPVSLSRLKEVLPIRTLLSFGCPLTPETPEAVSPSPYEPTRAGQVRVLQADELASLLNSQKKKILLWNALKQLFLQ